MEFGILGPLRVRGGDDREFEVNATQRRRLLLRSLTHVASVDSSGPRLEDPWSGAPPSAAAQTIPHQDQNLTLARSKARRGTAPKGASTAIQHG